MFHVDGVGRVRDWRTGKLCKKTGKSYLKVVDDSILPYPSFGIHLICSRLSDTAEAKMLPDLASSDP